MYTYSGSHTKKGKKIKNEKVKSYSSKAKKMARMEIILQQNEILDVFQQVITSQSSWNNSEDENKDRPAAQQFFI